jgi:hypothetical protein
VSEGVMVSSPIRDHDEYEQRQVVKLRVLSLLGVAQEEGLVGVMEWWSEVLRLHDGLGLGRF